ncbi:MAG: acyl-ACP--UDP-N-acetylglucosamine O-acyltransferase, partial [Lentisphaeria bacterium]
MTETFIHPTAFVEDGAIIGEGCYIGPYSLVSKNVVMGKNNILHSHVVIDGPTEIGDGNEFYQFCSIGAKTQDLKYVGEPTYAKIGDNNCFRESVTIHRGTAPGEYTIVGNNCNLLAYCHVAHNCTLGNHIIMSNAVSLAGHVTVSDRAIIGGMS